MVGGCVRDTLLNKPSQDIDYVVVGASPQEMLDAGFMQVGADFPVFLHPQSKDEYALARTERKNGTGYLGFSVYAQPDVTLEEDLARRDFTMNAIAQHLDTKDLVDPYNGIQDLQQGVLRHVSEAFQEDPVRVLRGARFVGKYQFRLAPETTALMKHMVANGELDALVAERIRVEMEKAFKEGPRVAQTMWDTLHELGGLTKVVPPEMQDPVVYRHVFSQLLHYGVTPAPYAVWGMLLHQASAHLHDRDAALYAKQTTLSMRLPKESIYAASMHRAWSAVTSPTSDQCVQFWTKTDAKRQRLLWLDCLPTVVPNSAMDSMLALDSICRLVPEQETVAHLQSLGLPLNQHLPTALMEKRLIACEHTQWEYGKHDAWDVQTRLDNTSMSL